MRKILTLLSLCLICFNAISATYKTTGNSNDWNSPSAWICSCIPSLNSGDEVIINHGITLNSDLNLQNSIDLTVNSGGVLDVLGDIDFKNSSSSIIIDDGGILNAENIYKNSYNASIQAKSGSEINVNNDFTLENWAKTSFLNGNVINVGGVFSVIGPLQTNTKLNIGNIKFPNGNGSIEINDELSVNFLDLTGSGSNSITGTGVVSWNNMNIANSNGFTCEDGTFYEVEPEDNPFDLKLCNMALPVHFAFFDVVKNNEAINVNWATSLQINNDYFVVEKSYDGVDFFDLTTIQGEGNSSSYLEYNFVDEEVGDVGDIYYRIKQVDYDGRYSYSSVKQILVKKYLQIYPHITDDEITISGIKSIDQLEVKIYNTKGQFLFSEKILNKNGLNEVSLSLGSLNSDIYYFNFISRFHNKTVKIIKKR